MPLRFDVELVELWGAHSIWRRNLRPSHTLNAIFINMSVNSDRDLSILPLLQPAEDCFGSPICWCRRPARGFPRCLQSRYDPGADQFERGLVEAAHVHLQDALIGIEAAQQDAGRAGGKPSAECMG